MATTIKPEDIERHIAQRIEVAQKRTVQFISDFAKYPTAALEGAQGVFDASAQLEALNRVQAQLARGISVEDILEGAHRAILNKARDPHRSTSATSNLIEQCRLAALVFVVEMLED